MVDYTGFQCWYTVGSKLMLSGRVCGDYVRCMPAAREGARRNERSLLNSIMCLFLAVIWLHSFLSGCEHLMYAFVFCISSLFTSFLFSSPSLLVGLVSVAPCRSSLLLHRFSKKNFKYVFFFYIILYVSIFNWSKIFIFSRYLNIFLFFFCFSEKFFLLFITIRSAYISVSKYMFTFEKLFKWILFQDVSWSTIHLRFFFCSVYDFIFVLSRGSDIYYYYYYFYYFLKDIGTKKQIYCLYKC